MESTALPPLPGGDGEHHQPGPTRTVGLPTAPVVVERRLGTRTAVFLHGFSFDRRMWDCVTSAVDPRLDLFVLDLPGFGEAPVPTEAAAPTDAVISALDAVGIGRVDLIGHSYGGEVALSVALAHPRRVSSLTLIGSGLTGFPTSRGWQEHMAHVRAEVHRAGAEAGLEAWRSHPNFRPGHGDLRTRLVALTDRYTGWHWTNPELVKPLQPSIDLLHGVSVPTLVMVGEDDTTQALDMAAELASGIPDARLIRLPGVGHVPPVEDAARVAKEIDRFLAEQPAQMHHHENGHTK
jgi:3-oxoadipate enol-lactonase